MNQWLTVAIVCCGAALTFSIFALWLALRASQTARNLPNIQRKTLTEIATQLEALDVRATETASAMELLANRVKMMRVRNAATHTDPNSSGPTSAENVKDFLRRKAGLTAGKPAKHQ